MISFQKAGTGALVIASMLDFLTYAVCAPYSETTSGDTFDTILKLVAERGRSFYRLFQSPSMTIVKGWLFSFFLCLEHVVMRLMCLFT